MLGEPKRAQRVPISCVKGMVLGKLSLSLSIMIEQGRQAGVDLLSFFLSLDTHTHTYLPSKPGQIGTHEIHFSSYSPKVANAPQRKKTRLGEPLDPTCENQRTGSPKHPSTLSRRLNTAPATIIQERERAIYCTSRHQPLVDFVGQRRV